MNVTSSFLQSESGEMGEPDIYTTGSESEGDHLSCGDLSDFDSSDFWSLAVSKNLRQSMGWSITLIIAYVLIFIIGMAGNIIVILVVSYNKPMRTVTNMFLINLAVADLLVTVFCVPATLLVNLFIPWTLGSLMCKAVAYVQGVAVCASACSLAVLSLDRCNIIFRSMDRHPGISKRQAFCAIVLIWIFSAVITLPWLFTFEVIEEDCQVYCVEMWRNESVGKLYFLLAHLLCCFIIPLLIICGSNTAIWCFISRRQDPLASVSVKIIRSRTNKGVRRTVSIVTSAFLISWLPLYAIATIMKFLSPEGIMKWEEKYSFLLPCAQWLGSFNSCVNPLIYAFINKKFRKGFLSFLCSFTDRARHHGRNKCRNSIVHFKRQIPCPHLDTCNQMPTVK